MLRVARELRNAVDGPGTVCLSSSQIRSDLGGAPEPWSGYRPIRNHGSSSELPPMPSAAAHASIKRSSSCRMRLPGSSHGTIAPEREPDHREFSSSLPDVATVPVVAEISADMSGQQPMHPATHVSVGPRPNDQMKMVGHGRMGTDRHEVIGVGCRTSSRRVESVVDGDDDLLRRGAQTCLNQSSPRRKRHRQRLIAGWCARPAPLPKIGASTFLPTSRNRCGRKSHATGPRS